MATRHGSGCGSRPCARVGDCGEYFEHQSNHESGIIVRNRVTGVFGNHEMPPERLGECPFASLPGRFVCVDRIGVRADTEPTRWRNAPWPWEAITIGISGTILG